MGVGSIFGFIGNFFLGYIPYKMWGACFGLVSKAKMDQNTNSGKKLAAFEIVSLTSSAACGIIIAWWLDLTKIVPFAFLSITITLNNFLAACVLGPILLLLLYPRVKRWGLIWTDIMKVDDVAKGAARNLGSILMIVGSLGGLVIGILAAAGLAGQTLYGFTGEQGQVSVWLSVLPFILLVVVAGFMLSGREQFVEEAD